MAEGTWLGEPAFDAHRPPSRDLVDDCVHCGFCLPTCPTYTLWGEEMDSPRGRIHLMKQGLEGEPMTDSFVQHIDACLGCMACVTACPSGVQYDKLIEATRGQVERRHRRGSGDRLLREAIFAVFPYPRRLRVLRAPLRAYQALGRAAPGPAQRAARAAGPDPGHPRQPGPAAVPLAPAARARARPGRASRRRGDADRLRSGGVLPRGQRGDRPRAQRRGVRRAGPAGPGLLRCAVGAQRPRGAGPPLRPAHHRRLRARQASSGSSSTPPVAAPR